MKRLIVAIVFLAGCLCPEPEPEPCIAASGAFTLAVELPAEMDACMARNLAPQEVELDVEQGECRLVFEDIYVGRSSRYASYYAGPEGPEDATVIVATDGEDCVYALFD